MILLAFPIRLVEFSALTVKGDALGYAAFLPDSVGSESAADSLRHPGMPRDTAFYRSGPVPQSGGRRDEAFR